METKDNKIYEIDFGHNIQAMHEWAVSVLLSDSKEELIFKAPNYEYCVKGGGGGHLYYKKTSWNYWILIANWCFYGVYIVVRYRKPLWLRPMYKILFKNMNFVSVEFYNNSIELFAPDGTVLRSRRFRFAQPNALEHVMKEKFQFSEKEIADLKVKIKWPYS